MDNLIGRKVKLSYRDGDKVKVIYGILRTVGQDIEVEFLDGRRTFINRSEYIRISEEVLKS